MKLPKCTYKNFYFIMSTMLYIGPDHDKEEEMNEFYIDYKEMHIDDPIEWAFEYFQDFSPLTHDIYIRSTFKRDKG